MIHLDDKCLANPREPTTSHMSLKVGDSLSLPSLLKAFCQISPACSSLGSFSKEPKPVEEAEILSSYKGNREELPDLADDHSKLIV